jgi:hypothetical protein
MAIRTTGKKYFTNSPPAGSLSLHRNAHPLTKPNMISKTAGDAMADHPGAVQPS